MELGEDWSTLEVLAYHYVFVKEGTLQVLHVLPTLSLLNDYLLCFVGKSFDIL